LTEMQSAIGRLQLQKLDGWIEKRHQYAAMLTQVFSTTPAVRVTLPPSDIRHAYYKYYVFVEPDRLLPNWSRDRIIGELNTLGVPCFSGSCSEIYLEKAFDTLPTKPGKRLPVARELGETSLMFLVHPTLTVKYMNEVIETIQGVFVKASR
jgi:dTDP-4-amino-4,6-dideoxygalactose transaminase